MKTKIPIEIVNLDNESCHLFVKIEFDKDKIGELVIDTGASKTCFDSELVKDFILEKKQLEDTEILPTGITDTPLETEIAVLKKMSIGKLTVKNYQTVLINLSHINKMYELYFSKMNKEKKIVYGLLGGDFLQKFNARINYKKKILTLEK